MEEYEKYWERKLHKTRKAIEEYLKNPHKTAHDVAIEYDLVETTIYQHVKKLKAIGVKVVPKTYGVIKHQERKDQILAYIQKQKGVRTQIEIARNLELDQAYVSRIVRQLIENGEIEIVHVPVQTYEDIMIVKERATS